MRRSSTEILTENLRKIVLATDYSQENIARARRLLEMGANPDAYVLWNLRIGDEENPSLIRQIESAIKGRCRQSLLELPGDCKEFRN